MNVNFGAPVALLMSLALTGFESVQAIVLIATPPTITGRASYEPPVRAGDTVLVHWTISKRRECPGENARIWDGPDGYHLAEVQRPAALGKTDGAQEFSIPTRIPDTAPPGDLSMKIIGHFDCPNEPRENFTLGPVKFTVFE